MNILIVDDDPIFNSLLTVYFEMHEAIPHSVFSLKESREYLVSNRPDLIVLDSYLTDGFGIELMADIQQANLEAPVILVTADNDQPTMLRYFEAGVNEYILKPVNLDLMWLKINRLLENQQLQRRVTEQHKALQKLLMEKEIEEKLASYVFQHLASSVNQENQHLNYIMQASTVFNGDFLISASAPDGKAYTMLLDATGHGLAAAISILPLISIFRTMVYKGLPMGSILYELNRKLELDMPDDRFVAGIMLEIDRANNSLHIWNGGMPDVLIIDKDMQIIERAVSKHMPLGIIDSQDFNTSTFSTTLAAVTDVLFFSDGVIEQENKEGESFGMHGILNCLESQTAANSLIERIENQFSHFIGSLEQSDDVSVCHLNMAKLFTAGDKISIESSIVVDSKLEVSIAVSGQLLGRFDLVNGLNNVMNLADLPIELRQKTFTVLSELFSNAFEHGVLGLNSGLKSLEQGFEEYFTLKEQRIETLTPSDKVAVRFTYEMLDKQIRLQVEDSGDGYVKSQENTLQNDFSGRGLSLVEKLSHQADVTPPGNNTTVVIK
jgi:two-component system, HptB-dependent secretion and biofilm response regulator